MRKTAALVLTVGLMASLAACSPATEEEAATGECITSGSASDSVSVSGDFGTKPEVEVEPETTVAASERTEVIEGEGEPAKAGDFVKFDYTILNGETGEEIEDTPYDGSASLSGVDLLLPVLTDTLLCSSTGSRVVGVGSTEGLADEGLTALGLTAESTLVIAADVTTIVTPLPKADGEDQAMPDGFPAVEVAVADDSAGTPTVTIPDTEAPAELQLAVLKKGDGAVVEPASDVVVNYQGTIWASKTVFDDSWTNGYKAAFDTSQVIPGFTQALEGQTVGSQVLVTIPPALGYGEGGQPGAGIAGTDTLVFIVDILGVG
ncbi:MAG TPA: FKBP-type peptidyl-prolyl cis-trans isomerase [Glaciihabitans sp.]|nr:FKBP-type peptidyl-prolyl cis-trans isomerase [Glaciihabitans sp.]